MAIENNTNGWNEYSKLVLSTLEDHKDLLKDISAEITHIRIEIGKLNVKSGMWGLVGGAIPVAIGLAIAALNGLI